jgi:hypothetical protein
MLVQIHAITVRPINATTNAVNTGHSIDNSIPQQYLSNRPLWSTHMQMTRGVIATHWTMGTTVQIMS